MTCNMEMHGWVPDQLHEEYVKQVGKRRVEHFERLEALLASALTDEAMERFERHFTAEDIRPDYEVVRGYDG